MMGKEEQEAGWRLSREYWRRKTGSGRVEDRQAVLQGADYRARLPRICGGNVTDSRY